MDHFGFLSVIPPIIAIALAIRTKQVYVSLIFGIFIGWFFLVNYENNKAFYDSFHSTNDFIKDFAHIKTLLFSLPGSFIQAIFSTINAFVAVFSDVGNTRTVIFTLLVGSLITLIQKSGGVTGFIQKMTSIIERLESKKGIKGTKLVQLLAAISGLLIFVESNISILTVGTIFSPLFERLNLSKEKLAYIVDSSSAPACILIPFNAWGAYVMGLLIQNGLENPFQLLFSSIIFNFYPIFALTFLFTIIIRGKDYGPMKKAQELANSQKQVNPEVNTGLGSKGNYLNMVIPILVLVVMMPAMLFYTGHKDLYESTGMLNIFFEAIGNGSGSASVLYSVIFAMLVAIIIYALQGVTPILKSMEHAISGMSDMVSLALLMVLAFSLGSLCKQLGTGIYVSEVTSTWLSPGLVPFILFITSCFIAFSTGTSWGTFAIMIAIAVPMAEQMDAHLYMSIAAVLGGGVFGDHCSPISDTTIISSIASGSDHVSHVRTQLPYAIVPGTLAALFYLVLGFII